MPRDQFHLELQNLQEELLVMSSMVEKAIERSVTSLKTRDSALAEEVIGEDRAINQQRFEIEEGCLLLIARQQPMASDLRVLAAILNIITDLERMGDHAAGIARITLMVGNEPPLKPLIDIPRMAEIAGEMLRGSLKAFLERNVAEAQRIANRDDEVDKLYNQVYRELLTFMMADPGTINRATHLLWAAHNLERIADRVTNICERVLFLVTGRMVEMKSNFDEVTES
ncbi:MAG: phosphate signaling complex protein PhoU [Chloroflexota bacterium]|nr:phosphate signaling complex protein PhoU [Chloroflexota bacterium]